MARNADWQSLNVRDACDDVVCHAMLAAIMCEVAIKRNCCMASLGIVLVLAALLHSLRDIRDVFLVGDDIAESKQACIKC